MAYEKWYTDQFRDTLGETLKESDGIPDPAIDSLLKGRVIPAAMRAYYRVAGRHWLNINHNELRSADELESIDGYTIFMDENQRVVQWAIRDSEMGDDDPIVYQGQVINDHYDWSAEKHVFSRFMIDMWKWVLTGEEPA